MAKDPAVLFYTSDFLTGTVLMNFEQRGKYITLLCLQHQKGLLTEKDMLNICQSYDEDVFCKFIKTEHGYYNERMKIEHEKRSKFCQSRSKNRLDGIENQKEKKNKKTKKSYVEHMENENIFNSFRLLYPGTKNGNKTEFDNFQKKHKDWELILPTLENVIKNQIQAKKLKKDSGQFVPEWKNLQTWINQKCWEEEIGGIETPKSKKTLEEQNRFVHNYINGIE